MPNNIKAWTVEFVTNTNQVTNRYVRETEAEVIHDCDELNKTDPFKANGNWSYRPITTYDSKYDCSGYHKP